MYPFTEQPGTNSKGAYFPDFNLIFVNDKYSDIEQGNIVNHEMEPKKPDHDHNNISASSVTIKQEAHANPIMC